MSALGVALFHTTSAALRAEKTLLKSGFAVKLVPTPREFSSDCGIALRFAWSEIERTRTLLDAAHVDVAAFHPL
jgi:hypothetical protein